MVARARTTLKIRIHWHDGYISKPYEAFSSLDGSDSDYYRRSNSYILRAVLYEAEYNRLCEMLDPLVAKVSAGYTEIGSYTESLFSERAVNVLEMIQQKISDFEFSHREEEGVSPQDALFSEELITLHYVEIEGLTEIYVDRRLIIDHSFTDIQLRQAVAAEIINFGLAVNDDSLFSYFQLLRDTCRESYQAAFV